MPAEQGSLPKSGSDKPASMPKDLAGAKPRYSYGSKQFDVEFESDVDRAAYIAAQKNPSKRDADYLKFVMDATGMDESQVRAHGQKVRDAIKGMAKDAEPGVLKVEKLALSGNVASEKPASLPELGSGSVTKDKKYFDKMTVVDMTDEELHFAL